MVAMSRQAGRVRLVVPCEIRGSKASIKVPVRDISLGGLRLASTEHHEVGEVLHVTLRLPVRIELSAEVRWVKTEDSKNIHTLGCRFVHTDASRQSLKDALQGMAFAIDSAAQRVK
jgi:hypothetical protein